MSDQLDWQLLDRYLAGDVSSEDSQRVRAWIAAAPERREMVDAIARRRQSSAAVNVDHAWQRVATRTIDRAVTSDWRRGAGWLAAAVVVIAAGSMISLRMLRTGAPPVRVATSWTQVVAPLGKRMPVTLPDSSQVILNSGSSLRYASTFGHSDRDVALLGEGYFTVRHDSARAFRVHANNASIQDVGTRFVVRAYDATRGTVVVVAEGAVAVAESGARHDTVVVTPGVMAHITPTGTITTAAVDTERYTGFTDGLLVLGDLTLAEAVPMIERWYDVDIRLVDPALGRLQLNANFRNEPLAGVLDALSIALDVDVRRSGRDVTIAPRKP